jgi:N-acetylmuramoyl-L-alanine amidase
MVKRNIDFIVIHCTATPQNTTVQSILNYWKNILKWRSPGYHILIDTAGKLHQLSHFDKTTNGVKGHNARSIHISYIGGIDGNQKAKDTRTTAQKAGILEAIKMAIYYADKKVKIQGHRDFPNVRKDCPSFDAKREYSWITI